MWVEVFFDSDYNSPQGVATDSNGNVYVTGFSSYMEYENETLTFITKYDGSGNKLWMKRLAASEQADLGERGIIVGQSVTTGSNGTLYIAGYTDASLPGNTTAGGQDAFVARYDSSGTQLWVKQFGTSGSDFASSIITDSSGYLYIAGSTDGSLPSNTNAGSRDAFLARYAR